MRRLRMRVPSPALVMSVVALAIALGGTSYAAFSLPNGSVGTAQLKNKAVTNAKLGPTSVGTAKIRSGAVGITELGVSTPSSSISVPNGTAHAAVAASCPSGTTILDGGGGFQGVPTFGALLQSSAASGNTAWLVEGQNFSGASRTLFVRAICIKP